MSSERIIEQKEFGDYRVSVWYDQYAQCPTQDMTLCGHFIWENDHCISSYSDTEDLWCTPKSLEDVLKDLVCRYVSQKKVIKYINEYTKFRFFYHKDTHMWSFEYYSEDGWRGPDWYSFIDLTPKEYHGEDCVDCICDYLGEEDFEYLLYSCQKEIAFTTWASHGYCQGNYARGVAYCDIERFKKNCGNDSNWRNRAVEYMLGEAELIGKWMWNDVYGFTLEKKERYLKRCLSSNKEDFIDEEWEEVESCGGFYTDYDDIVDYVIKDYNLQSKITA